MPFGAQVVNGGVEVVDVKSEVMAADVGVFWWGA
jgi:hypothetical protein